MLLLIAADHKLHAPDSLIFIDLRIIHDGHTNPVFLSAQGGFYLLLPVFLAIILLPLLNIAEINGVNMRTTLCLQL